MHVTPPGGGYFLWVALAPGFDALLLHQRALEEGISIAPGPVFSARRTFSHCVRLNHGQLPGARLEEAMKTLGRLIRLQAPYG